MISDSEIIDFFYSLDDFIEEFNSILDKSSVYDSLTTKKGNRKFEMYSL